MQYLLFLDLKDDPALITAYEAHHRNVWPEILTHIRDCGVIDMRIFRCGNRLVMLMDTKADFSFAAMTEKFQQNPRAQAWEILMDTFQQRLPWASAEEKWVLGTEIFALNKQ